MQHVKSSYSTLSFTTPETMSELYKGHDRRKFGDSIATQPAQTPLTHQVKRIRNSDVDPQSPISDGKPWLELNQLGDSRSKTTPIRLASSDGTSLVRRLGKQTLSGLARASAMPDNFGSTKKKVVMTPHGRAAQRKMEIWRAGMTPSRDRSKGGRQQQRETPRDDLRTLSRLLAPKTQPMVPNPEKPDPSIYDGEDEDEDKDDMLPRPRLSLALEPEDEDESLLLPPHSAGLEDENFTVQSVELPRRALSEHDPRRTSRFSFGSLRMSDAFADLSKMEPRDVADESSYLVDFREKDNYFVNSDHEEVPNEDIGTSQMMGVEGWSPRRGRESGIRPTRIVAEDTDTFILTVPQREGLLPEPRTDSTSENEEPIDSNDTDIPRRSQSPCDETSLQDIVAKDHSRKAPRKKVKVSKYGIQYPSVPAGVVKKLASNFARTAGDSKAKITKETLEAVMQATDWFFEQVSDDLRAYAQHAGRKTIDESDVIILLARQRQTNATTTPFSLARRYLPRELLQEIRLAPN